MEGIKAWLDVVDLAVKVGLAVLAFLFFGVQKDQLDIQQKQLGVQQAQQTQTLVVAEKIISLLFEEKNKCIAEDQAFLLDFLIDTHNAYNTIKINKSDFLRASAARRQCQGGPVSVDAKAATEKNGGQLPLVTAANAVSATRSVVAPTSDLPEGTVYVSLGNFDADSKAFRNFSVRSADAKADGSVIPKAVITARWPVYLRTNTNNTTENSNPVIGVLKEGSCVEVINSMPNLRGQTWALVRLVACAPK